MRWRRPPFALVLTAVIGLAALAVVVAGTGNPPAGGTGSGSVKTGPSGRVHACLSSRAQARVTQRGTVSASAAASAPLHIVEKAQGSGSVVTVTRGASFKAQATGGRVVGVAQVSVASAHACATAASEQAARGLAIRHAYGLALASAHREALAGAQSALHRLERHVFPSLLAHVRSAAQQKALAEAQAARPTLTASAHQQAVRLANRPGGH